MNPIVLFALGYYIGSTMNDKKRNLKPKRLSECAHILPGMQRTDRNTPVEVQNISLYRNLIENPYNFPG